MFRWLLQPDKSLTKCSVGQLFKAEQGLCSIERSAVVGVLWLLLWPPKTVWQTPSNKSCHCHLRCVFWSNCCVLTAITSISCEWSQLVNYVHKTCGNAQIVSGNQYITHHVQLLRGQASTANDGLRLWVTCKHQECNACILSHMLSIAMKRAVMGDQLDSCRSQADDAVLCLKSGKQITGCA